MRSDFYTALDAFFAKHPEYKRNPLWVTGESYGGKYVPNVAYEIQKRGELALKGIIIGNGIYSGRLQYPTVAEYAYNQGLIDDKVFANATSQFQHCVELIEAGKLVEAEKYCEDAVRDLYASNASAGGVFYYDVGLQDSAFLDTVTDQLSKYLNSPETKKALHVGNRTWGQSDETGPVAEALFADFCTDQGMRMIEALLEGGFKVVTYNGVRDGSVCNHVGNLNSMEALQWTGAHAFRAAGTAPWRPAGLGLAGYKRSAGPLTYYTLRNTGHLVPMIVPGVLMEVLKETLSANHSATLVV
ncbi:unnamed protein product [Effrenium voratum]|nr:unnamed protein product [Effrenium voratum]